MKNSGHDGLISILLISVACLCFAAICWFYVWPFMRIPAQLKSIDAHLARLVVVQEAQLRELRRGVKTSIDWTIPLVLPKKLAEER
jgi:hypothetical protein